MDPETNKSNNTRLFVARTDGSLWTGEHQWAVWFASIEISYSN